MGLFLPPFSEGKAVSLTSLDFEHLYRSCRATTSSKFMRPIRYTPTGVVNNAANKTNPMICEKTV